MKPNFGIRNGWRRHAITVALAGLLLPAGAAFGRAAFDSPAGTIWDCVMSGPRDGLAQIVFLNPTNAASPGSFGIDEIIVPRRVHIPDTSDDSRGTGGNDSRSGTSTNGTFIPAQTNIFGWESTVSLWGYDTRGRIIGYWYEITPPVYSTNVIALSSSNFTSTGPISETNILDNNTFLVTAPLLSTTNVSLVSSNEFNMTNPPDAFNGNVTTTNVNPTGYCVDTDAFASTNSPGVTNWTRQVLCYLVLGSWTNQATLYSNSVTASAITNQVSFSGTVSPGRHLALLASTPAGKVTFSGVPDVPLNDLSGSWTASKRVGYLQYYEFLTLDAVGLNAYEVSGTGPAYMYSGMAFVFPQRKMAIALGINPVYPPNPIGIQSVRAAFGSVNLVRMSSVLQGLEFGSDAAGGSSVGRFTFTMKHQ